MKFLTIGAIIFSKGLLGQTFIDVAASHNIYESYASTPDFGGGVSFFDFDNDGQVDVVIGNTTNDNSFLWQNTSMINNFIKISLKGSISNRMAIGSWIYVYAGGICYSYYTMCGENFLDQNSQHHHHLFGLAQHQIVDSVVIEFLSGNIDKY